MKKTDVLSATSEDGRFPSWLSMAMLNEGVTMSNPTKSKRDGE